MVGKLNTNVCKSTFQGCSLRLFFLQKMPEITCGNLTVINNAMLMMTFSTIINYMLILLQFRYNDKQQLALELAEQNINSTRANQ